MLFRFRLFVFFDIGGLCLAVHFFRFVSFSGTYIVLFHLKKNKFSGEGYCSYIMSGTGFDSDHISFFERYFGAVQEITFPGIFELYFYIIGCVFRIRYVAEPIVGIQFCILYFAASLFPHAAASFI